MSRALVERTVRRQVEGRASIELRHECRVESLVTNPDGDGRVTREYGFELPKPVDPIVHAHGLVVIAQPDFPLRGMPVQARERESNPALNSWCGSHVTN